MINKRKKNHRGNKTIPTTDCGNMVDYQQQQQSSSSTHTTYKNIIYPSSHHHHHQQQQTWSDDDDDLAKKKKNFFHSLRLAIHIFTDIYMVPLPWKKNIQKKKINITLCVCM